MENIKFNPCNPEYKKIEDLPLEEQKKFVNHPEGGFIRKEAMEEEMLAEIAAIIENSKREESNSKDNTETTNKEDFLISSGYDMRKNRKRLIQMLEHECFGNEENGIEQVDKYINDFSSDRIFMEAAIRFNSKYWDNASEALKNNRNFLLNIAKTRGILIRKFSEEFKKDKKILLEAIKSSGHEASYILDDKDINKVFSNDVEINYYAFKQYDPKKPSDRHEIAMIQLGPELEKRLAEMRSNFKK
jgi:hypothetical protein